MSNNILLNSPQARFEPHLCPDAALPFRFHRDTVLRQSVFNIHQNIELLLFLTGEGQVMYDGTPIPVAAGDVVVVNSYSAHQVTSDHGLTQFCLIIDSSFCRYNSIDPAQLQFQPHIRDEETQSLFRRAMAACTGQDPFRTALIKSTVLELLVHLCRQYSCTRTKPLTTADPALSYIRAATEYINQHLADNLTAENVAASVGLSKFHFLRQFKRLTGYTLTYYINAIRCEYAQRLLAQGDYKVKEVAHLCGFSNHSYFSSVFQQHTGMHPSQLLHRE